MKEDYEENQSIDEYIDNASDLSLSGKIYLSGTWFYVGTSSHTDGTSVFITDNELRREPTYMSLNEAKLLATLILSTIYEAENP